MLADILEEVDEYYNFQEIIFTPEKHLTLTENLLYDIEVSEEPVRVD